MLDELQKTGTEHISLPVGRKSPATLMLIPKLREILRGYEVDVLHARSRVPAWLSVLALKRLGRQRPSFLTTVHGLYSVNRFSRVMTRGDYVVCVSETVKRYVRENYPRVRADKLRLIYRGVDPVEYSPRFRVDPEWEREFRSTFGLGEAPLVVLPGRLTRLKGHMDFLRLMRGLRDAGSNAIGLIVGGEDPRRLTYAAELREAVAMVPNVIMTGHSNDLRRIMRISSVVVSLSSKPESFGRTVLEALSLGVPVAGYDHGGVGEVLAELFPHGRVGLGDTAGLVKKVSLFLNSPQSPEIVENTKFTLGQMLAQTVELYESVGHGR